MVECPRCGVKISPEGLTTVELIECNACGFRFDLPVPTSLNGLGVVRNYFSDVWQIITRPRSFFRHLPLQGGISHPLGFALITHWLGAAFGFLWRLSLGGLFTQLFHKLSSQFSDINNPGRGAQVSYFREQMTQWFLGTGPVILDPFLTLISILFTSFLVFIAARILMPAQKEGDLREVTYESAVRITCFGMSPAILSALPFIGSFVAPLGTLIITVIGVREAYRISNRRAIAIALFPKLLVPGIIVLGLIFFSFMVIRLFFG